MALEAMTTRRRPGNRGLPETRKAYEQRPEVRARRRRRERDRHARYRAEYLAGKACNWCGGTENLTIDHIDRTKKVSNTIWNWGQARREAELLKTQVLCWACHIKKSRTYGDYDRYAKITYAMAEEIRALKGTMTQAKIGERYGIHHTAVSKIHRNVNWVVPRQP